MNTGPTTFRELKDDLDIAAALENGRRLFAGSCDFVFGAQKLGQLPPLTLPEIAFAGRSNVGKSSLVNALTGRKTLARASSEPGRTKQLNFFDLAGRLMLVDMPGYGYARAAKSVKEDWQDMMFDYLRGRPVLRRVVLLLDARVELKTHDREVMDLLDRAAVSFQVVLTKCDDVKPGPLARKQAEVEAVIAKHPAAFPYLTLTSSQTGLGMEALRAELAEFALP
ncbi:MULTISPECIES: ribosome biogenesis GTP-binding protein YihA/YsxC [Acetobacter]|jgi:GTP-binding protein|uniref:Probable GTP-binding protein EngB n=1 Tax=Acetobacter peroxydans TaxID=104098 RepID=A0A4Y3TVA4_9PROT|nr:ribosome biogenesis GTP-binding protein YihA/YsxC [Acetobacter peroxydans]MCH4093464.1 ribosome biogenesis GTP-binding protein YihA/YsxC [Acetobacter peroxydans]MCH4143617.1 ribosome biogenesis GTP-binding protein YihA/YsxC [Acetobacter peroxydans]MCI1410481.1 ribosome biogenesis GTP-binding protein YihA/YsxC [Acetobacter peroxydans]MCI1439226.1 ribosome biogenesis GTP-binding protein YihA/YsxC [Acetobacter peroxydans]MCI1565618.1 ribosome biogenesis GTP-binding protein YihA/YsxC [Acetobact